MRDRVPSGRLRRLGGLAALVPKATLALARDRFADEGRFGAQVAEALGELKAGSLKVGQILAQVADELPPGAALRLGQVFGEAPSLDPAAARRQLEAALGQPPEALFARFEDTPFAVASIGQVHRAETRDGVPVAVKIRYPGVDEALARDLEALGGMAGAMSAGDRLFDASTYFRALREHTLAELDFAAELRRLDAMRAAVAPWPDLRVPRAFPALSAPAVLTLELIEGPTLHAALPGLPPGEREGLARRLTRAVLGPIFSAGQVNADAHPGNFIVQPGALALLDFGAVIPLAPRDVAGFRQLCAALLDGGLRPREALAAAGYELRLSEGRAEFFAEQVFSALLPPFRGPHDHSANPMLRRMMKLKEEHPLDVIRLRPPAGLLPVVRAMVGLSHALRRMPGPIDLRPAIREALAVH